MFIYITVGKSLLSLFWIISVVNLFYPLAADGNIILIISIFLLVVHFLEILFLAKNFSPLDKFQVLLFGFLHIKTVKRKKL